MVTGLSRKGRMLMGRLERGTDIVKALRRVCADNEVRCGQIQALGALEHVEVCAYDQKAKAYGKGRVFRGNLEILSLLGNVSEKQGELAVHLHITVARETDNGIQILGGHLLSGKVFACEFVVHTCDDLILRRGLDRGTGLPLWQDKIEFPPDGDDQEALSGPGGTRGGETRQVANGDSSASGPEPSGTEEEGDWLEPVPGDILEHPTFGRVTVERSGEDEFVHVRLKNDRLVRLSLDVLRLKLVGHERGRQVFKARIIQHGGSP